MASTAVNMDRPDTLLIASATLTGLAFLIVALRLFIRFAIICKPFWDDYCIIVAMVFSIAYFAEIVNGYSEGFGKPMTTLTPTNMVNQIRTTLAIQVTYYVSINFTKISILCTYLRFAVTRTLRNLCYGTIVFHSIFLIVCIATTLSQCQPLEKMWDLLGTVPGHCINTTAFFYFTSSLNIVTDIWILSLPIKTLMSINRPKKEKTALIALFGAGVFATITSIVRLHTIYTYTLAKDPFLESISVNLWSVVEVNIALMCASVPALKLLFTPRRLFKRKGKGEEATPDQAGKEFHSNDSSTYAKTSHKSSEQSWSGNSVTITSGSGSMMSLPSPKVTGGYNALDVVKE